MKRANFWYISAGMFGVVLALTFLAVITMHALVRHFGADRVLAYTPSVSVATSIFLAMLTAVYVYLTSKIAEAGQENSKTTLEMVIATKRNSDQQARVADLMEKDLRERIAPFLDWRFEGGPSNAMVCRIINAGKGAAIKVEISRQDKGFETPICGSEVLAPNKEVRLLTGPDTEFKATCEDSLGMAHYTWRYHYDGRLQAYSQEKVFLMQTKAS